MRGEHRRELHRVEVIGVIEPRLIRLVAGFLRRALGIDDALLQRHPFGERRVAGRAEQPVRQEFRCVCLLARQTERMEIMISACAAFRPHPVHEADALLERGRRTAQEHGFVQPNRRQRAAQGRKRALAHAEDADVGRFHQRDLYTLRRRRMQRLGQITGREPAGGAAADDQNAAQCHRRRRSHALHRSIAAGVLCTDAEFTPNWQRCHFAIDSAANLQYFLAAVVNDGANRSPLAMPRQPEGGRL